MKGLIVDVTLTYLTKVIMLGLFLLGDLSKIVMAAKCRSDCNINDDTLECWRINIDFYSNAILQAVNQRAIVANHIGEWKRKRNLQIYDPVRAAKVIENIADKNPGPMPNDAIKDIFTEIVNQTTVYEEQYHAKPPKFECPDVGNKMAPIGTTENAESHKLFKVIIVLQSIILIAQCLALGIMGYYLVKERRHRKSTEDGTELRPYK